MVVFRRKIRDATENHYIVVEAGPIHPFKKLEVFIGDEENGVRWPLLDTDGYMFIKESHGKKGGGFCLENGNFKCIYDKFRTKNKVNGLVIIDDLMIFCFVKKDIMKYPVHEGLFIELEFT